MTKRQKEILFSAFVTVLAFIVSIVVLTAREYQAPQPGCVSNISRSECT